MPSAYMAPPFELHDEDHNNPSNLVGTFEMKNAQPVDILVQSITGGHDHCRLTNEASRINIYLEEKSAI